MKVKVVAPFPMPGQTADGTVELPDGTRVRDLLRNPAKPPLLARFAPVSVNGVQAGHGQILHDGDLVIFILPTGGG